MNWKAWYELTPTSALVTIAAIVDTARAGNAPLAVSPLNITASAKG
jgi:hypothetical protein